MLFFPLKIYKIKQDNSRQNGWTEWVDIFVAGGASPGPTASIK